MTKIVSQVKQEITKVGGLNDYLVKELEEFATNPDLELEPDQRAPALQLLVMFERSPTRVKEILGDVLEEDDWLGTEVYEVALNFYPHQQPGASAGDPGREEKLQQLDMKALEVVLEHLQSPEWPQALAPDYARFLGRFQPRYADRLAAWLKENMAERGAKVVADGLLIMPWDEAIVQIVKVAEARDPEVSRLGWVTLAKLDSHREFINQEVRRDAIRTLWSVVGSEEMSVSAGELASLPELLKHIEEFRMALDSGDPGHIEDWWEAAHGFEGGNLEDLYEQASWADPEGLTEASISELMDRALRPISSDVALHMRSLVNLLRTNPRFRDWEELVVPDLMPRFAHLEHAGITRDNVYYLWFARLAGYEREERGFTAEVASKLIRDIVSTPGWEGREQLISVLSQALERSSPEGIDEFFQAIEELLASSQAGVSSARKVEVGRGLDQALRTAMRIDRKRPRPYEASLRLVESTTQLADQDQTWLNVMLRSLVESTARDGDSSKDIDVKRLAQDDVMPIVRDATNKLISGDEDEIRWGVAVTRLLAAVKDPELQSQVEGDWAETNTIRALENLKAAGNDSVGSLANDLKARLPWHGRITTSDTLDAESASAQAEEIIHTLIKGGEHPTDELWYEIKPSADVYWELESDDRLISFMVVDADQETVLKRGELEPDRKIFLTDLSSSFTRYLSVALTGQRTGKNPVRLHTRVGPAPFPPDSSRERPHLVVTNHPYPVQLSDTSEIWLTVNAEDAAFEVETSNLVGTDTVITLYSMETGEEVDRDDDGGGQDLASLLSWEGSAVDKEYLIRINDYDSVESDGGFEFIVREIPFAEMIELGSARDAAVPISVGETLTVRLPNEGERSWALIEVERGSFYSVQSLLNFSIQSQDGHNVPLLDVQGNVGSVFVASESGEYMLEVYSEDEKTFGTVEAALLDPELLPTEFKMTPVPDPKVILENFWEADEPGYVVTVTDPTMYAFIDAQKGRTYHLSAIPLGGRFEVNVDILRLVDDEEQTVETEPHDGDAQRAVRWTSVDDAGYYARVSAPGAIGKLLLLNSGWSNDFGHNGFVVGDRVILGPHDDLDPGGRNWADEMEQYVGQAATITELRDQDESGSYLAKVDIDDGDWVWRTRNMRLAPAP